MIWDLSPYLNSPPTLPIFTIPTSTKLYRNTTITLSANSTDDKTSPNTLTPQFQYKSHTDSTWSDYFISESTFSADKWHADFTPDPNATLGFYDLRVRFTDESAASSEWKTLENAVDVLNNPPEIIWISHSSLSVYRGQEVSLDIEVFDLEDDPDDISIQLEYSNADDNDWKSDIFSAPTYNNSNGKWFVPFSFPYTNPTGIYDLRMRCTDADGNFSIWNYLNRSVNLLNNPPEVSGFTVNPSEIFRGNSPVIFLEASDPENGTDIPPPVIEVTSATSGWETLEFRYNLQGNNFTSLYETNATTEAGKHSFRAKLTDRENNTSSWYYLNDTLTVKNNPPAFSENFDTISVYNDRNTLIDLVSHASDYENSPSELTWEVVEYSPILLFDAYMKNSTAVEIWPASIERTGLGKIKFKVFDKESGEVYKNVTVEIINVSSLPDIRVVLDTPENGSTVGNASVNLAWTAEGYDDAITYDVYFGDSPENMSLKFEELDVTNIQISGLIDGIRYFWKVTTMVEGVPAVFESEIWYFTVQFGFTPIHNIELTLNPSTLSVKRGESAQVTLTLRNLGNEAERVEINVLGELKEYVSMDQSVELEIGEKKSININILAMPKLQLKTYELTVEAVFSGESATASMDVKVTGEKGTDGGKAGVMSWVWFVIGAILILAIAGLLIFVILRRRKEPDDEEEVIAAEIEAQPRPGITRADLDLLSIGGSQPPPPAPFQGRLSYTLPSQQAYQHKSPAAAPSGTMPEIKDAGSILKEAEVLPQTASAPPVVDSEPVPTVSLPQAGGMTQNGRSPEIPALPVAGTAPASPGTSADPTSVPAAIPTRAVLTGPMETVPAPGPEDPLPPPDAGTPEPPS